MSSNESLNAPEFFFHHGFIDKIWADWQEKGITFKQHEYSSNTSSMPGTIYTPHDLDDQPYCVKVCYQEPEQECSIGGKILSVNWRGSKHVYKEKRFQLSPNPILKISQQTLTIFGVLQSIVHETSSSNST